MPVICARGVTGKLALMLILLPSGALAAPPGPTVPDSLLAEVRGKADVHAVDQKATVQNTANVEGNSINGTFSTGTITIGNEALDNFNGLALFSINTGNNVAINGTMTVNVAIQQ